MVIDLGEAKIFERKMANAIHRGVNIRRAAANIFE